MGTEHNPNPSLPEALTAEKIWGEQIEKAARNEAWETVDTLAPRVEGLSRAQKERLAERLCKMITPGTEGYENNPNVRDAAATTLFYLVSPDLVGSNMLKQIKEAALAAGLNDNHPPVVCWSFVSLLKLAFLSKKGALHTADTDTRAESGLEIFKRILRYSQDDKEWEETLLFVIGKTIS